MSGDVPVKNPKLPIYSQKKDNWQVEEQEHLFFQENKKEN
jgi:hypothetical protein